MHLKKKCIIHVDSPVVSPHIHSTMFDFFFFLVYFKAAGIVTTCLEFSICVRYFAFL